MFWVSFHNTYVFDKHATIKTQITRPKNLLIKVKSTGLFDKIKLNNPSMIIKNIPINKILKNKVNLNPFDNFHI